MAADSTYTIHYLILQEYHATVSLARQAFIGPLENPPPPKPKPPKRPSQPKGTVKAGTTLRALERHK